MQGGKYVLKNISQQLRIQDHLPYQIVTSIKRFLVEVVNYKLQLFTHVCRYYIKSLLYMLWNISYSLYKQWFNTNGIS